MTLLILLIFIFAGAGLTTTLIALIANAGIENQAIATAGKFLTVYIQSRIFTSTILYSLVSVPFTRLCGFALGGNDAHAELTAGSPA